MKTVCFRIHLKDDAEIDFIACGGCEEGDECFAERLAESTETGFLSLGDPYTFIIPVWNIDFIERIPDYELDEDD